MEHKLKRAEPGRKRRSETEKIKEKKERKEKKKEKKKKEKKKKNLRRHLSALCGLHGRTRLPF